MLGVIAGTGFYNWDLIENQKETEISTPYGSAVVYLGDVKGTPVAFLPRHKKNHSLPPHKINYRANIYALHKAGVKRLIAINAVGSLDKSIGPGEIVLIDDFLDFTYDREHTFYDGENGKVGHADMSSCYCSDFQGLIKASAAGIGLTLHTGGVYVATQGPRFETRAEIRAYGRLGGTVVGMTGVPECPLAVEMGICYAGLSYVTNYACGVAGSLNSEAISKVIAENKEKLEALLQEITKNYTENRQCQCGIDECLL
ncbi:MAG: S-methyl-5'-thioadenosine phosphorylase [Bacillota bacterium]|jgi:5'-methylthioadenosine phosphorylase